MKKNIALIGYGNWGKKVSEEIKKNNNFNLEAIVSSSHFLSQDNTKFYKNIDELIAHHYIDCIYIAKNPKTNFKILNLLKYKKIPMILEKPFCDNSIEGLKIIKLIDENKIKVFTNLPNIYSDTYEFTKKLILNNIKHIDKIIIHEGSSGPQNDKIHPILDWGIHSLSYILSIFEQFKIKNINYKEINKTQDHKFCVSKFDIHLENKIYFKILTGNFFKKKTRILKVILKNGEIFLNDFIRHEIWHNNKLIYQSKKSPLENLLNIFADSINNKTKNNGLNEINKSLESIQIIEKFI